MKKCQRLVLCPALRLKKELLIFLAVDRGKDRRQVVLELLTINFGKAIDVST